MEFEVVFGDFQWWLVELSLLREFAVVEKRLAGYQWIDCHEADEEGQLSQRARADALLGAAADLRTNPRRTRARNYADGIRRFHAAE